MGVLVHMKIKTAKISTGELKIYH